MKDDKWYEAIYNAIEYVKKNYYETGPKGKDYNGKMIQFQFGCL